MIVWIGFAVWCSVMLVVFCAEPALTDEGIDWSEHREVLDGLNEIFDSE